MNPKKSSHLIGILFSIVIMLATLCVFSSQAFAAEDCQYLSDMDYVKSMSKYGYREVVRDKSLAGTELNIKVDNNALTFKKGLFAHAPYTLVYDISEYYYDYFTAFLGVNTTAGVSDGVKFYVYTSADGKTWDLRTEENPKVMKKDVSAQYVKIPIESGTKYIKFYIDQLGGNGSDHSVIADAKLVPSSYFDSVGGVKPLSEYDKQIKTQLDGKTEFTGEDEHLLLQREFVNKVGFSTLEIFARESEENKQFINWLMNDIETLRYYVLGGEAMGTYANSFKVLKSLLDAYKEDLNDTTVMKSGRTRGDLFRRMMVTLSFTHASTVRLWVHDKTADGTANRPNNDPNSPNVSNPLRRYEVYKKMYLAGKLHPTFEYLEIEEMRYVLNIRCSDDEIEWLRDYIFKRSGGYYGYNNDWIRYRRVEYYTEDLYNEANKAKWDAKYDFLKYGIKYEKYYPSLWMGFEKGGICWQISQLGANCIQCYGLPSMPIGQPGHSAYFVYNPYGEGNGRYSIYNSGWPWAETNFLDYEPVTPNYRRPPNGWGRGSYTSGYPGSYIWLTQASLNDYPNYEKSQKIVMLANTYAEDYDKAEALYREAIKVQKVNFNAWLNLTYTYIANKAKTSEDYYRYAQELVQNFTGHPKVLYDLMKLIEPYVTEEAWKMEYTMLISNTFQRLAQSGNADIRTIAEFLLGSAVNDPIASFSFDGEYAGQIRLGRMFNENNLPKWEYSLNDGVSYTEANGTYVQLSKGQINSINNACGVRVRILGLPASSGAYKIEIKNDLALEDLSVPRSPYANDLENKIMGVDENQLEWYKRSDNIWISQHDEMPDWKNRKYEWKTVDGVIFWRYTDKDIWVPFTESRPDMTGNTIIRVRMARTGTRIAFNDNGYEFTKDNYPDTRRYVPVSNLSVFDVSSQTSANPAANSIDGETGSYVHAGFSKEFSKWVSSSNDTERYIVFKTVNPMYLSSIEYIPSVDAAGRILDGKVYGSMDGENWTELASMSNWANNVATKTVNIANPMRLQYIKIVGTRTQGGNIISARHFNFFQNVALNDRLYGNIEYSTTEPTNQDVTVHVTDITSSNVIFDSEGGDSYVFTENGTHEFKFHDSETGKKGSVVAAVDWIDKTAPEGTVEYSTTEPTNGTVTATLILGDDATIITDNSNSSASSNPNEFIFMENGEYTFKFKDAVGNIGTATAKVDWIDTEPPMAEIEYNKPGYTKYSVTATLTNMEEGVTVVNNGGSNTYTFEDNGTFDFVIQDRAGNTSTIKAEVTWIHDCDKAGDHVYEVHLQPTTCTEDGPYWYECKVDECDYMSDKYYLGSTLRGYHTFDEENWIVESEPTCTENGLKWHECMYCEERKDVTVTEKLGHTYIEEVTAPTCTSDGYTTHTCSTCTHTYVDNVIPAGHKYKANVIAPTCIREGYTIYTCTVCNDSYVSDIITAKHTYTEEVTAPTCTVEGYTTYTCSVCGHNYRNNTVPTVAHTPVKDEAVAPNCTESGLTEGSHCEVCGEVLVEQETVPAAGHDYSASVTKEATCAEEGIETYTCTRCGDSYTEAIPVKEHTPVTDPAVTPTCVMHGKTEGSHCGVCGAILAHQEDIPMTSHSYTPSVTKEPTCTEEGITTFSCDNCDAEYTTHIEKLDHTPVTDPAVAPTCKAYGMTEGSHCSVCEEVIVPQEEIPMLPHDFAKSEITKEPTCKEKGERTYSCNNCDATRTEDIELAEHTPETIPAVEPTCAALGKTEGSRCSVCKDILEAPEDVEKKPHEFNRSEVTTDPTCITEGVRTYYCDKCGETKTEPVDKLDYHKPETVPSVEPTCTSLGKTAGSRCSVCGLVIVAQEDIEMNPHEFNSSEVTTAPRCDAEGVRTYYCDNCNETKTETLAMIDHDYEERVTFEGICIWPKQIEKTCKMCGITETITGELGSHKSQDGKTNIITAATCTTDGLEEFYCGFCYETVQQDIPATGHTIVIDPAVEMTCKTEGKTEGSHCSVCGEVIVAQEIIPIKGHNYSVNVTKEPTCSEAGVGIYTCPDCGDTYTGEIAKLPHTPVTDEAVAPNCTENGKTEGSHCDVCGEIIAAQETVTATGHDYVLRETKEATCNEAGFKAYTCSKCGENYTEEIAITAAHTPVTDPAVPSTCTTPGRTEGSHCSVCGEILTKQEDTDMTGHEFSSSAVTTEPTCAKEGVRTYTCIHCKKTQTESIAKKEHTPVTDPAVSATCTTPGKTEGSHCSVCDEVIIAQETLDLVGHDYVGEETAPTCTKEGEITYKCSNCDSQHVETIQKLDHAAVAIEAIEPTCTEAGQTAGSKCFECGFVIKAPETVPATGHDYDAFKVTNEPTCEAAGEKIAICLNCGDTKTEEIPVIAHTVAINPAIEPTCTTPGKTEGEHCSVCGEIIKAQEEVPVKGHNFALSRVTKEPTCAVEGEMHYTCSHCTETKTEPISKIAHTVVTDPAIPATCIVHGKTEGSHCSVCGEVIKAQEDTDLTDHEFSSSAVTTEPTCAKEGVKTYICIHCMKTKTESIAKIEHTPVTDPAVPATCTVPGKTVGSHCSVCGETIVAQKETALKAHTYTKVVTKPTCTTEGYTTYTCSACGHSYVGDKVSAAHTYKSKVTPPTCTAEGYTTYTCSVCGHSYVGNKVPVIKHSYTSSVTKAATCTESGIKTFKCSACGKTYTEEIPATGHKDSNKDKICDVCSEPFDPSEGCKCLCHKDGFLGIIYMIVRIIWRHFHLRPVCDCGVRHY